MTTVPSDTLAIECIPAFTDNYFWLLVRGTSAAVVDPGDAGPVERTLSEKGLSLDAILLTHHHPDHIGGVDALREATNRSGLRVYGPAHDGIAGLTDPLEPGERIHIASLGVTLEVIDVGGHTRGHIAYFIDGAVPRLFCGDALFVAGCGRLFEGSPEQMHASLMRLSHLPENTEVYCAHEYTLSNLRFARTVEPDNLDLAEREQWAQARRASRLPTVPSTIGWERRTNPFLRCNESALREAARARSHPAGDSEIATFAALRAYKDVFR